MTRAETLTFCLECGARVTDWTDGECPESTDKRHGPLKDVHYTAEADVVELQAAQRRLEAIDTFLCENGLLKAENPDEDDALFLTPGGYWESRECDDVGDHVDAIKKLMEWSREAGYWDAQPAPTGSKHVAKGKDAQ